MGKMFTYMSMFIFIDLLLIITGQICGSGTCGLGGILFNAIINLTELSFSEFFTTLIGDILSFGTSKTGLASLLVGAAVTIGFVTQRSDTILFIGMALTLGLVVSDIIFVYTIVKEYNFILATIMLAPLAMLFIFTALEWARGKD